MSSAIAATKPDDEARWGKSVGRRCQTAIRRTLLRHPLIWALVAWNWVSASAPGAVLYSAFIEVRMPGSALEIVYPSTFPATLSGSHTNFDFSGTTPTDFRTAFAAASSAPSTGIPTLRANYFAGARDGRWAVGSSPYDSGATVSFDDLLFSGPTPSVETSLSLELDGAFIRQNFESDQRFSQGLTVRLTIFDENESHLQHEFSLHRYGEDDFETGEYRITTVAKNMNASYDGGPVALNTGTFVVPTGTPLTLVLSLATEADVYAWSNQDGDWVISGSDFGHTLTFPVSEEVFTLPDGYSATAPGIGLINNAFTAVPEPPVYSMLTGIVLLLTGIFLSPRRFNLHEHPPLGFGSHPARTKGACAEALASEG